ncbi:MAG: hypothetical protein ABIQ18_37635 [Umezawaea sp.]
MTSRTRTLVAFAVSRTLAAGHRFPPPRAAPSDVHGFPHTYSSGASIGLRTDARAVAEHWVVPVNISHLSNSWTPSRGMP